MRLGAHTAAERLRDIRDKHAYLDDVPFRNPSNHKFRDLLADSKTRPFKLTSSVSPLRVYDCLQKNRTN